MTIRGIDPDTKPPSAQDYLPGDIVAWDPGREILGDEVPSIVHTIGAGVREEDIGPSPCPAQDRRGNRMTVAAR